MTRDELTAYLDTYLSIHAIPDRSLNGLQVEGDPTVTHLAYAVDACQATIDAAIAAGAQMLLVHHGLFWGEPLRIVGAHRRRVQALLAAGCSLYAAHLPLDLHAEVGNNVQLARLTGLTPVGGLAEDSGRPVGVIAAAPDGLPRAEFTARIAAALGVEPLVQACGPEMLHRVAIISGGAARWIDDAAAQGCDTFFSGETSHSHYHDAAELGLNVIYAGHYATETVGLHAMAQHLRERFGLTATFVDRPTGM
jgi:dinuclear metal center YbgI/SA1388 family protein